MKRTKASKNYYESHKDECTDGYYLSRKLKLQYNKLVQQKLDLSEKIGKIIYMQVKIMMKNGGDKNKIVDFIYGEMKGIDTVEKMLMIHEVTTSYKPKKK